MIYTLMLEHNVAWFIFIRDISVKFECRFHSIVYTWLESFDLYRYGFRRACIHYLRNNNANR